MQRALTAIPKTSNPGPRIGCRCRRRCHNPVAHEARVSPVTVPFAWLSSSTFDNLLPELVLGLGLALLVGNGLAWLRHRQGRTPEGVEKPSVPTWSGLVPDGRRRGAGGVGSGHPVQLIRLVVPCQARITLTPFAGVVQWQNDSFPSCRPRVRFPSPARHMIFSDRSIREAIDGGTIVIDPFEPSFVQPSSVDLRVGDGFRVFENHRYSEIDPRSPQDDLTKLIEVGDDEAFMLHPGEFVLGSTLERVNSVTTSLPGSKESLLWDAWGFSSTRRPASSTLGSLVI